MLKLQQVDSWAVIFTSRMKCNVQGFVSALQVAAAKMELRLPQPDEIEIKDDYIATYVLALENTVSTCNPKLILVVIPNNRLDRYRYVKIMKSCDF
jgi:protein involved in ribonucleotide reduction